MSRVFLKTPTDKIKFRLLALLLPRYRRRSALAKVGPGIATVTVRTIYFEEHKLAVIKNPKCACSSVSVTAYEWTKGTKFHGKNIHKEPSMPWGTQNIPAAAAALTDPDVFRFSFIRNPIRRASSGFLDFFVKQKRKSGLKGEAKHGKHMRRLGFDESAPMDRNFDVFLDYLDLNLAEDLNRIDPHFRPQYSNLRPDLVSYDFLGRVENLHGDLVKLAGILRDRGQNFEDPVPVHQNKSDQTYNPSKAQVARLEKLFAKDFETFEFDAPR